MRGKRTIVTAEPLGYQGEGVVGTGLTFYPGMIVQKDYSVALASGRFTYKVYDADADGGRPKSEIAVVTENLMAKAGKGITDAVTFDSYAAGERFSFYVPLPGDELNLLILNLSGTGDDHAIGEVLIIDDTTGKMIATTGSPETEVAVLQEAITDPTADTQGWVVWTGY